MSLSRWHIFKDYASFFRTVCHMKQPKVSEDVFKVQGLGLLTALSSYYPLNQTMVFKITTRKSSCNN